MVGTRKNGRARRRHACLPRARPFCLSPATSKRLLRRLKEGRKKERSERKNSFRGEASGGVAKCPLFSQAAVSKTHVHFLNLSLFQTRKVKFYRKYCQTGRALALDILIRITQESALSGIDSLVKKKCIIDSGAINQ